MEVPVKNGKPLITNEMKADCIGEFSIPVEVVCACEGNSRCEHCGGEMVCEIMVDVPWTMVKDIYKRMALVASQQNNDRTERAVY